MDEYSGQFNPESGNGGMDVLPPRKHHLSSNRTFPPPSSSSSPLFTTAAIPASSRTISVEGYPPPPHGKGKRLSMIYPPINTHKKSPPHSSSKLCTEGNVAEKSSVSASKGGRFRRPERVEYVYVSPMTSSFYNNALSPLCDYMCEYLPPYVHPNAVSVAALLSASSAFLFLIYEDFSLNFGSFIAHWKHLICAILWCMYSVLDNLDGKQARKLQKSSPSGEFVDHACDSFVVTMAYFMWSKALFPYNIFSMRTLLCVWIGQYPFLLATWGHVITDRLLLGSTHWAFSWFTVDELNFLAIPFVLLVRQFFPCVWDYQLPINTHTLSLANSFYDCLFVSSESYASSKEFTVGALMIFLVFISVSLLNIQVFTEIVDFQYLHLLAPAVLYTFLASWNNTSAVLIIVPFSLLCIELINSRLLCRLLRGWRAWWPILLVLPIKATTLVGNFPASSNLRGFLSHFVCYRFCCTAAIIIWVFRFVQTIHKIDTFSSDMKESTKK